ncbi:hypothetical protein GQX74_002348 [Glossina fuscipes]|nr:hypothetical protein GQX74_002348 [Glossina fuscipes]
MEELLVIELLMLLEPFPTVLKRKTSGLPVMRCNAKYDSNACKFKAVAAGELTGSNAACCRLLTIVPCSDNTTAAAAAKSLVVVVVLEVLQFLMTVLPEVVTSFIVVVVLGCLLELLLLLSPLLPLRMLVLLREGDGDGDDDGDDDDDDDDNDGTKEVVRADQFIMKRCARVAKLTTILKYLIRYPNGELIDLTLKPNDAQEHKGINPKQPKPQNLFPEWVFTIFNNLTTWAGPQLTTTWCSYHINQQTR